MKNKKSKASSILEFVVVFVILFMLFITLIDLGLFFRQIYLVQTMADETLSKLQIEHVCSNDIYKASEIMQNVVRAYYKDNIGLSHTFSNGFYKLSGGGGNYIFNLSCRNSNTPDALLFGYKYYGIFLFKGGKMIFSNFSANTSYF